MAQAKTIKFAEQLLMLGNGATPTEVFTAPCGFTSLNLTVNIETSSTNVPDCANPDLPAWLESDEVSKQMTIGGNGVMDRDAIKIWRAWLLAGGTKNVRWFTSGNAAAGGGYWQAPGILSTYEETGERGQRWQLNIGITLSGAPIWTNAV